MNRKRLLKGRQFYRPAFPPFAAQLGQAYHQFASETTRFETDQGRHFKVSHVTQGCDLALYSSLTHQHSTPSCLVNKICLSTQSLRT